MIVNPDSGPGDGALPNEQYTEAVAKLSSYPNAELLGYVRTGYATRNITEVLGDINVYAGWSSSNSSLAMHGIFLDEAPHEYSASAVDFLRRVGQSIKSATGLQGPKRVSSPPRPWHAKVACQPKATHHTSHMDDSADAAGTAGGQTIYNPGTIPDTRFDEVKPDVTVVFEDDYGSWQASRQAVAALPPQRSAYGLMINSVPPMSSDGLRDFVRSLSNIAEHLFITTNREGFYESIADRWVDFINSVPV